MGNKNVKPTLPETCYSEIYYRLGTAQLKRENYTEALKSYSKSVELDPHNFNRDLNYKYENERSKVKDLEDRLQQLNTERFELELNLTSEI